MLHFISENHDIVIAASLLTAVMALLFRPLAIKASFLDAPNDRKVHQDHIPLTGGVSIFLSSVLTFLIFFETFSTDFVALMVCGSSMLALGMVDDRVDLPAFTKLFIQSAIALIFVTSSNFTVSNLGAPLGFSGPLELGMLSVPFTLLAIVGTINAFNMIDGCDGLASCLVIVSLFALLTFGVDGLSDPTRLLLLVVFFCLLVFLLFNFSNSKNLKTFLGDGGSLFLGFVVATSFVEFSASNNLYDPAIVLWFAAVPIFDFFTVILMRRLLKRKITTADRSHIHHSILSLGFSHFQTTALISAAAVALLLFGVFVTLRYPSLSFLSFFVFFLLYFSIRMFAGRAE